jgi:hypothetical protein
MLTVRFPNGLGLYYASFKGTLESHRSVSVQGIEKKSVDFAAEVAAQTGKA